MQYQPSADDQAQAEQNGGRAHSLIFNSFWLWGSGFLILLGAALGETALALLGTLTLATAGGAWLWARYSLRNVVYSRTLEHDRVFPGETVPMRVSIVNRKFLPLAWIDIEDRIPDALRIVEQEVIPSGIPGLEMLRITTAMRWFERVTWRFTVQCPTRGFYTLGPVELRSGDLFVFFNSRAEVPSYASVTVYPRIVGLDDIGIPPRHLFGDLRIRRQIVTDPSRVVGVRDYRPEDSFRHVNWKATARTQTLQTKVFEPSTEVQFGVFLNLDTFEHYWEGIDYDRAEAAITIAASLAKAALDGRQTVGLFANGVVTGSDQPLRVRPSRNPDQTHAVLSGLARLSPIASLNFPRLLRGEVARFPFGSTVVVITAMMSQPLAVELLNLSQLGHRIVLVTVDEVETPSISGMEVFRISSAAVAGPKTVRRSHGRQLHPSAPAADSAEREAMVR